MFNGSEKVKLQYQMPLCLWFSAARLETVTAGQADNHYRLRPADRGNLVFQVKALPNRYKCKLYRLVDILVLACCTHAAPWPWHRHLAKEKSRRALQIPRPEA